MSLLYESKNAIAAILSEAIVQVVFGDGGSVEGKKKLVSKDRTTLFGVTRVVKPAMPYIEGNKIIVPIRLDWADGNDMVLNEVGLKLKNGNLLCMETFVGVYKTDQMKLSWNWEIVIK